MNGDANNITRTGFFTLSAVLLLVVHAGCTTDNGQNNNGLGTAGVAAAGMTGGLGGAAGAAGTVAGAGVVAGTTAGTAGTTAGMIGTTAGVGGAMAGVGGMTAGTAGMTAGTTAGTGVTPDAGEPDAAVSMMGTLPPVDSVEEDGPFEVTIDMNAGENSWVFRPTDLGRDGLKHPIFVWGTGATSVPMQYTDHFTRVASHGIVVISPNTGSVNAARLKASLDWIIAENDRADSVFYQKLDTTKIAMGGHSLGSVSTFDQEAMESRLTTTIHIAGGSFDNMGSSKVKTPTAYMCGQMDLDLASPNCAKDYENATKPTYFVQLEGVDHVGAARSALPGIVAWLRWWLGGETWRKDQFIGTGCDFCQGIWANAQSKNW